MARAIVTIFLVAFLAFNTLGAASAPEKPDWPTFQGLFFSIKYPPNFSPRPGIRLAGTNGCDSAFFLSPDKAVEFYVFSPQWSGDPKDIAPDPKKEVVVSRKMKNGKHGSTAWTTIRARNRAFTRSIVATLNNERETTVAFAVKYRDSKSYAKYKADYARFKASLVQYAD